MPKVQSLTFEVLEKSLFKKHSNARKSNVPKKDKWTTPNQQSSTSNQQPPPSKVTSTPPILKVKRHQSTSSEDIKNKAMKKDPEFLLGETVTYFDKDIGSMVTKINNQYSVLIANENKAQFPIRTRYLTKSEKEKYSTL